MISLDDRRPAWHRPAGAQQRRLPLRHKRLAKIIDLAKNLDDPIQHHRLHHSAMAAYLKKLFRHNPLVAQKPLIRVTYVYRPAEAAFPPFFDQVVIARLAAEFCLPLTENSSRAEALAKLAELEFRRARLIDNQQDSQLGFEDFTLIEARA